MIRSQYYPTTRNVLLQKGGVSTRVQTFVDDKLNALLEAIAAETDQAKRMALVARRAELRDRPGLHDPDLRGAAGLRCLAVPEGLRLRGGRPAELLRRLAGAEIAEMVRYLIGRVGQAVVVLAVTFTAAFLLLQVLPGDAIMIKFMSPEMGLNAEQIAEIRASYGADLPLWQRYLQTRRQLPHRQFRLFHPGRRAGRASSSPTNLPPTLLLASLAFVARRDPHRRARGPVEPHAAWAGCAPACSRCRRCSSRCRCSGSASC